MEGNKYKCWNIKRRMNRVKGVPTKLAGYIEDNTYYIEVNAYYIEDNNKVLT